MQTGNTGNMDGMPGGGGQPEWSESMAAGLCSGIPSTAYLVGRLMYGHDWSGYSAILKDITPQVESIAKREKWRYKKDSCLPRLMAELALMEAGGIQEAKTDKGKAEFLELDAGNYCKYWKRKYQGVYDIVARLGSEYSYRVGDKLRQSRK